MNLPADIIRSAMAKGQTISFRYRNQKREAYPLLFGELNNGRIGLLCYKRARGGRRGYHLAYRMYLADCITDVREGRPFLDPLPAFNPGMTRNFREIILPSFREPRFLKKNQIEEKPFGRQAG